MTTAKTPEKEVYQLKDELERLKTENTKLKDALERNGIDYTDDTSFNLPSRSKMWSSISHEILTPMDAILGMTDLVMDTDLSDEQRNYLEMINASADRLFGVISDVIDYSELLEGRLRKDIVNFDFFEELEYDLYISKLSAKHKDLKFSTKFSKEIPSYLSSDPSRLRQVLNNIISNAIKYTEEGDVTVKAEKGGHDDSGRLLLRFSVSDTGVGISDEARKLLFRRPIPIGLTGGEEKYSEGGLGLVVSAKLVELFGGEIGVRKNKGVGSTFWFTWPVENPVDKHMGELPPDLFSEKQESSLVLRGADVLLAEDEPINASVTKAFLELAGINVTIVENGKEAVDAVKSGGFQAILMDVQMPVMDGIEATRKIRRHEKQRGSRCPIIALTAHAMQGDRERCLQAGMDDYLPKPLDKGQLVEMLARYLTRKALIIGSNPVSQHDLIQPLVERGWAVAIAETGKMAMYEASLAHYDMIVVDSSLSVSDGLETIKTIRKLEEFSGYRSTIVGVGFSGDGDYAEYSDCGFDHFYAKPGAIKDFTEKVEQFK